MSGKGKATLVRTLVNETGDMKRHQAHYRLTPPLEGHENVVVSSVYEEFRFGMTTHETYIFPANTSGKITAWGELDGSYQGGMDHARALENAGYEIVTSEGEQ